MWKVRDEVEQLLEDDDDMANFYLSRKLGAGASPMSWLLTSPANLSKAGRASTTTHRGDDRNDVKELEMLLEVTILIPLASSFYQYIFINKLLYIYFARPTSPRLMPH